MDELEYKNLYEEYLRRREHIRSMGGESGVRKQNASGKWTARERISYFFDPGTFVEIGSFVRHRTTDFGMSDRDIPGDGVVVGFGKVGGRMVMTASEDYTSMAGTFGEYHGKKFAESIDFARTKGIPFVGMNDSGGARLQEGMDTLESYGWLFRSQITASGVIPQLALIMGPCLGGQAYHPVMQDFVIQCRKTGFMGIAGPAFVETQTGEVISVEKLCGFDAQSRLSGQTHVVAEDDKDCLDKAKELLSFLPQSNGEKAPVTEFVDEAGDLRPELDTLIPFHPSKPFDMHELIKRVVDDSRLFEISASFAKNAIVGFARIQGRPLGVVASQPNWLAGAIDCDAADKIARFVRFCDLFNLPLLNIHDTPGYMIGSRSEWKGILRHGAKMLYSYIEATVPKITLIVRKSYAGAYTGMCCKDTGADIVFAWPNAKVSIVGAETAASVIFAKEIADAANPEGVKKARIEEYRNAFENPYKAAERGYIDDVILPRDTRKSIIRAFEVIENKTVSRPAKKYSNINL